MATPILTRTTLPGVLGDLAVDVRAGSRSTPKPAVIVAHGFKGFKDRGMFPPFADRLARAGFVAVSFDFSGAGVDGEGRFTVADKFARNTFSAEVEDLRRVVTAVQSGALGPAPTSIGVVGHSRGGGIAILLASRTPEIGAIVTWAAISTVRRFGQEEVAAWRRDGSYPVVNSRTGEVLYLALDLLEDIERNMNDSLDIGVAAARLACPWLLIHGTADETVPFVEGKLLAAAAPVTARLTPVEGATHTFGAVHPWAGATPELERVFDESIAFLSGHLD
ncbi:MAG: alpha/beta hydrolase [Gemmatimonadales bacterium]